jgi:hypothetical protein
MNEIFRDAQNPQENLSSSFLPLSDSILFIQRYIVVPKSITNLQIISNIDLFDFTQSEDELKVIDGFRP